MGQGNKRKKSKKGEKWYKLAKEQGYRSRAAFKLIQLNKKYNFLSNSRVCLDLCAAPGGWLQVASKYMPVSSVIIGVDLLPIRPIKNVITLTEDITTQKCRSELKKHLRDWKADIVLHDGSPNMGSAWLQDAYGQAELVLMSLKLATEFLKEGGTFITKVFRSADYNSLLWVFHQLFKKVEATKPVASRSASAEIFVVCREFLKPDKLDPKFLDPRHVFKDLEAPAKSTDLFNDKRKRQREGYEDGTMILFKEVSVHDFIEAKDPISMLAGNNKFKFDAESEKYTQHPKTTAEIKHCCEDLKVLGKNDFKSLLKWRLAMKAAYHKKEEKPTETEKPKEKGEEEKEQEVDAELNEKIDYLSKKERKKKKKEALLRAKQLERQKLNMGFDTTFEAPSELGLFSIDATDATTSSADVDEIDLEALEEEEEKPVQEDDGNYDETLENLLDQMYEQYVTTAGQKVKRARLNKKEKTDEFISVSLPKRKQVHFPDLDHNVEDELDEQEDGEQTDEPQMTKRAAQWFSKPAFEGLDSDDDEQETNESAPEEDVQEQSQPLQPQVEQEEEEEEASVAPKYVGTPLLSTVGENEFEVVPQQTHGSSDEESEEEDIEALDVEKQIDFLALGTMMLDKKRKREIIDESYNRYAWNDREELPKWFVDEERQHNTPLLPITKELSEKMRQRFLELNARPIKKVAEAKARKKRRALKRLEKVKTRAESVAASSEMSEKEKLRALQKIYKGANNDKTKRQRVYMVAKKESKGRVRGGRGIKVVDPRLKKDKRAEKRAEKGRKGKGKRR